MRFLARVATIIAVALVPLGRNLSAVQRVDRNAVVGGDCQVGAAHQAVCFLPVPTHPADLDT